MASVRLFECLDGPLQACRELSQSFSSKQRLTLVSLVMEHTIRSGIGKHVDIDSAIIMTVLALGTERQCEASTAESRTVEAS